MNKLSPIVLFTYNRPIHTQKILDSLSQNIEAKKVFFTSTCDGAKENATQETIEPIKKSNCLAYQKTITNSFLSKEW
ncbi:MAG: hypothetical protein QM536_00945 [Chitinophagaceae bacterium]|nr:hypothetical protein [Chitinophagaceae bacterium]